jgi:DNA-binding protein H-NS
MRNDISGVLSSKAALLRKELAFLGESVAAASRALMPKKRGSLAGTKVPAKYRGPKGELWAGRGAEPLWMRDAIKKGKKREDFFIDKSAIPAKTKGAKKGRRGRPAKKKAA